VGRAARAGEPLMCANTGETNDPGSIAFLKSEGFEGFRTVSQLNADRCEELPNIRGIYAIVRESLEPPQFMAKSAAARFRDTDPTLPIDELEKLWVPAAQILYFGRARGPGVRSLTCALATGATSPIGADGRSGSSATDPPCASRGNLRRRTIPRAPRRSTRGSSNATTVRCRSPM